VVTRGVFARLYSDVADGDNNMNFHELELAKLWIEGAKIAGALAVFAVGLWQYRRAQSRKRMEFIAQEINTFRVDPMVKDVFQLLDWEVREIDLGLRRDDGTSDIKRVTYAETERALLPHFASDVGFDAVEVAIR
jgi:hypothetical protein